MKWWIGLAAALYPRKWRAEFDEEFRTVLDDVKPSWRVFRNVLKGAIEMRMTDWSNWARLVAAMAVAGAIAGFGVSYRVAPVYVSSATISVTPVADPLRPTSPEVLRQGVMQHVAEMQMQLLSRSQLASIIIDPRLPLYSAELRHEPLEDVIERMRHSIRMEPLPPANGSAGPTVFRISFAYPDAARARATVAALAAGIIELNMNRQRMRNRHYGDFRPTTASVLAAASLPVKADPNRFAFLGWGLGIGALLGWLTALTLRWPRHASRIAGFAAAGCVLAGAASFLIPNRYTSTAVMQVTPVQLTPAPPAADFLRRMKPEVLNSQSLAKIVEDPRLELYRDRRAAKPIEEEIQEMRNNLSITPMNGGAFSISFTWRDRFKAQQTVTALISNFEYLNMAQGVTTQRNAAAVLDVLDIGNLPHHPVYPNRWMIAAVGLCIGVLMGGITLGFRKPGTPAFEEAQSQSPDGELQDPSVHLRSVLNRIALGADSRAAVEFPLPDCL